MPRKLVIDIIVALLTLLFIYVGVSKLLGYAVFKNHLSLSPWPPLSITAHYTAWILPALQLLIACLLVIPRTRTHGLWLSLLAMLLFTGYILILLTSGVRLPYTCGGVFELMTWESQLVFNTAFTLFTIAGISLDAIETLAND